MVAKSTSIIVGGLIGPIFSNLQKEGLVTFRLTFWRFSENVLKMTMVAELFSLNYHRS